MEKTYTTKNVADNCTIVQEVINILKDKKVNIVLLIGELGSGKTTFVKYITRKLRIQKPITSPTFLISKEYLIEKTRITNYELRITSLIHYDLYRLRSQNDLKEIGFWEKIDDRKNLIVIEWPDKIKGLTGKICNKYKNCVIKINFYHIGKKTQRKIKIAI